MKDVTVKKDQLLEKLKANKAEHRKIFEEALEGYRKRVINLLTTHLEAAKAGKKVNLHDFDLYQPQDQTKDYDRAITMIEMSVDDNITLTENDFRAFVMDDWNWQHNFLISNSLYSGTAVRKASQQYGNEE